MHLQLLQPLCIGLSHDKFGERCSVHATFLKAQNFEVKFIVESKNTQINSQFPWNQKNSFQPFGLISRHTFGSKEKRLKTRKLPTVLWKNFASKNLHSNFKSYAPLLQLYTMFFNLVYRKSWCRSVLESSSSWSRLPTQSKQPAKNTQRHSPSQEYFQSQSQDIKRIQEIHLETAVPTVQLYHALPFRRKILMSTIGSTSFSARTASPPGLLVRTTLQAMIFQYFILMTCTKT